MASSKVLDKFRGCLLGGLVGDCFGAPFEYCNPYLKSLSDLTDFLAERMTIDKSNSEILGYTDDTEMALSVAESLIVKNGLDAEDMVNRFANEYYKTSKYWRGYGGHVYVLFKDFKNKKYKDVYDPARSQFNGEGSLGNGGAMRTHPVALFCYNKSQETLLTVCRGVAQLTHTHLDGYNGAILQVLAIKQALDAYPGEALDQLAFLEQLDRTMSSLEAWRPPHPEFPSFSDQIKNIWKLLEKPEVDPSYVGNELGNDVSANLSVPSAIYCFLRAQNPIPEYETDNPFLRTLYLSVALGGDTDTIACMACSIAGAYYGLSSIPEVLYQQCEGWSTILEQANRMGKLLGLS